MQSWCILPPWRNGNLHSLPDVVRTGSRAKKKKLFVSDFLWTQMGKKKSVTVSKTFVQFSPVPPNHKNPFNLAQKLWSEDSKSTILSSESWIMQLYHRLHTYTCTSSFMLLDSWCTNNFLSYCSSKYIRFTTNSTCTPSSSLFLLYSKPSR